MAAAKSAAQKGSANGSKGPGNGKGGGTESAAQLLELALARYPAILNLMLEKACIPRESGVWAQVLSHQLFRPSPEAQASDTVSNLIDIFVVRNLVLWKAPNILAFLQKGAQGAMKRLDARDPVIMQAWQGSKERVIPAALYRHILISNFSDTITTIPREALEDGAGNMGDLGAFEAGARGGGGDEEVPNRLDPNGNPLMLFLQSMLPWNNAPPLPDDVAAALQDDPDQALAWELQRQAMLEDEDQDD